MKIKNDFVLRKVAGTWIVLPLGTEAIDATSMLTLNETGALLWKALEQGADYDKLVNILTSEYDILSNEAIVDVEEFTQKLQKAGYLYVD